MGKIVNKSGAVLKRDEKCIYGTVIEFLEENGISYMEWGCLSDLVKTMTGDAVTSFNTIGEMIKEIPEIVSCGEECGFLCVFNDEIKWFILGWNYEDNIELCNKILHVYFSDYEVVED